MKTPGKHFRVIVLWAVAALIVACCGNSHTPNPIPGDTIIEVADIHFHKQQYIRGATFETDGDRLWVGYADGRWGYINSGFTQEWSKDHDYGPWTPIQQGDPIPVTPFPYGFYVRADYQGMKGVPAQRIVN